MKRIIAMILAAMMLCCALVACDNGGDEAGTGRPSRETTAEQTTEEKTTEEETTPEETTDDGLPDLTDVYVDVWDTDDASQTDMNIAFTYKKGVGIAVTVPEGGFLYEASVLAPSYSDNLGSLTIKVFAWNTDYETTVAAEPVYTQQFVDYADNSDLVCEFEENQIPGGRYLILVCDGVDQEGTGVGVWAGKPFKSTTMPEEYVKYEIESWINGKANKKLIAKFSLTITELEEE